MASLYDEIWKPITVFGDEYAKLYEVSNFGRVRSWAKLGNAKVPPSEPRILKPHKGKHYYSVIMCAENGKRNRQYVHRLVALTFLPNNANLPQVNHKDGNKLNNNVNNLEWCTHKENHLHALHNGLIKVQTIRNIYTGETYLGINDAIKRTGLKKHIIYEHMLGTKGYKGGEIIYESI